jgi:hypothetical protein
MPQMQSEAPPWADIALQLQALLRVQQEQVRIQTEQARVQQEQVRIQTEQTMLLRESADQSVQVKLLQDQKEQIRLLHRLVDNQSKVAETLAHLEHGSLRGGGGGDSCVSGARRMQAEESADDSDELPSEPGDMTLAAYNEPSPEADNRNMMIRRRSLRHSQNGQSQSMRSAISGNFVDSHISGRWRSMLAEEGEETSDEAGDRTLAAYTETFAFKGADSMKVTGKSSLKAPVFAGRSSLKAFDRGNTHSSSSIDDESLRKASAHVAFEESHSAHIVSLDSIYGEESCSSANSIQSGHSTQICQKSAKTEMRIPPPSKSTSQLTLCHKPSRPSGPIDPMIVYCRFNIFTITDINVKSQTATIEFYFEATWHDPDVDTTLLDIDWDAIWQPKVVFTNKTGQLSINSWNCVDESYEHRFGLPMLSWRAKICGEFVQQMFFHSFPYDRHNIDLLVSSDHTTNKLIFEPNTIVPSFAQVGNLTVHGEWNVTLDTDFVSTRPLRKGAGGLYANLGLCMKCERKPQHTLANVMLLMFSVVVLFLLTVSSVPIEEIGNRNEIGVNLILTAVALKLLTADALPNLPYLTLLDRYMLSCIFFMITLMGANFFIYKHAILFGSAQFMDDNSLTTACTGIGCWILVNAYLFYPLFICDGRTKVTRPAAVASSTARKNSTPQGKKGSGQSIPVRASR